MGILEPGQKKHQIRSKSQGLALYLDGISHYI